MAVDKIDLFKDNLAKILATELPYDVTVTLISEYATYYKWLENTLGPKWLFTRRTGRWNILSSVDTDGVTDTKTFCYIVYFKYEADATLFALRWL